MIAQVSRWGDSLALRIPSALAQMLTVTEGRSVELRVENGSLLVTPVQDRPVYRLDDLLAGMDPDASDGEIGFGAPAGDEAF